MKLAAAPTTRHPSESWGPFGALAPPGPRMDASLRWHDGGGPDDPRTVIPAKAGIPAGEKRRRPSPPGAPASAGATHPVRTPVTPEKAGVHSESPLTTKLRSCYVPNTHLHRRSTPGDQWAEKKMASNRSLRAVTDSNYRHDRASNGETSPFPAKFTRKAPTR